MRYLCFLAADPAAARRLGRAVRALTPSAERGADFYLLDWRGLERLHGPAEAVAEAMARRLAAAGVHVGGAGRKATALLAARAAAVFGRPCILLPPGTEAAALAPWPLALLAQTGDAATAEALAVLAGWGIRCWGELAALPAAELHARLGPAGLRLRALARGEGGPEALASRPPAVGRAVLRRELEPPLADGEALERLLARLLAQLARWLDRRDRLTDRLDLRLGCEHAPARRYRARFSPPLRQARAMAAQLQLALRRQPPPAAVTGLRLRARLTPPRPIQPSLFAAQESTAPAPEATAKFLSRLAARLDRRQDPALGTPRLVDSHQPGAFQLAPFQYPETPGLPPRRPPQSTVAAPPAVPPPAADQTPPPPVLRAHRPPLTARVRLNPAGEPVAVATGGGPWHVIARRSGPWRSSGGWWTAADPAAAPGPAPAAAPGPALAPGSTAPPRRPPARETTFAADPRRIWDWEHWDVQVGARRLRLRQDRRGGGWVCDGTYD